MRKLIFTILLTLLVAMATAKEQQTGKTTRYWDCCKPFCSRLEKGLVTQPVKNCAKNGLSLLPPNEPSTCDQEGGITYACNDNQPWSVNDTVSYGFAAANIVSQGEWDFCCRCYELTFTSGPVVGKKFVAQVTNIGADLGDNHFDLMVPGGGVGIFNGCATQWGAPEHGWGYRYGGVQNLDECDQLPIEIRAGCKWRFEWFKDAFNPKMSFEQVTCPTELVKISGCERTD